MKGTKSLLICRVVIIFLLSWQAKSFAQATHYVFFQTENDKPFYLRIMGSTLSSNASGYLLIPKLTDGKYEVHIGFARSETEQQFEISVEGRDLGFSVKQELDNSWSLFNLVDFSQYRGKTITVMPKAAVKTEETVVEKGREEQKPAEKEVIKQADALIKAAVTAEKPKTKQPLPQVSKIYDRASAEGIDMIFVVPGTPKSDTVIIYVPAIKPPGMAGAGLHSRDLPGTKPELPHFTTVPMAIVNNYKKP